MIHILIQEYNVNKTISKDTEEKLSYTRSQNLTILYKCTENVSSQAPQLFSVSLYPNSQVSESIELLRL